MKITENNVIPLFKAAGFNCDAFRSYEEGPKWQFSCGDIKLSIDCITISSNSYWMFISNRLHVPFDSLCFDENMISVEKNGKMVAVQYYGRGVK